MSTIQEQITSILLEMRRSLLSTPIDSIDDLAQEYGIVFSGEKGNLINSVEFCHMLNKRFSVHVSHEDLLHVLPDICAAISMPITPLSAVDNSGSISPCISEYTIQI